MVAYQSLNLLCRYKIKSFGLSTALSILDGLEESSNSKSIGKIKQRSKTIGKITMRFYESLQPGDKNWLLMMYKEKIPSAL